MPVTVAPETTVVNVPDTPVRVVTEKLVVLKDCAVTFVASTLVPVIFVPLKVPVTFVVPETYSSPMLPVYVTSIPEDVVWP